MKCLTTLANLATIGTAVMAVFWSVWFWNAARDKRIKLENYLRAEKSLGKDKGRRTMIHLMSKLSLTEDEIFHAAFRSKHIECPIIVDRETSRASDLYFVYKD